jgi:hypothetical protein
LKTYEAVVLIKMKFQAENERNAPAVARDIAMLEGSGVGRLR